MTSVAPYSVVCHIVADGYTTAAARRTLMAAGKDAAATSGIPAPTSKASMTVDWYRWDGDTPVSCDWADAHYAEARLTWGTE